MEKQAAALVKEAMLQSHATQRRLAEEQKYGLSVSPEKMREGKHARIKRLSSGGEFVGSLETEMPYTSRGLTEEYADYEQEGAHSPENITQVHPSNIFEYAQPASKVRSPLVQESAQIERNGAKGPPPRHVLHQRQALTAERTVCVCVCVCACVCVCVCVCASHIGVLVPCGRCSNTHNTHTYTCTHTHIHTHTHIQTHTHTHTHTQIQIHTYTHTHTHTLVQVHVLEQPAASPLFRLVDGILLSHICSTWRACLLLLHCCYTAIALLSHCCHTVVTLFLHCLPIFDLIDGALLLHTLQHLESMIYNLVALIALGPDHRTAL
jgi:hypothetical protein